MNASNNLSRRSFLTGATMLGASVALFGLNGCAPRSTADAAEEEVDGGTFDIVVVGAGGAGMAATVGAVDAGASVVLLEKMPVAGGNTCFAEGGMNACCTKYQAEAGIEDSVALFANDTYEGGHELGNMELITYMCANSNDALEWLGSMGIVLSKLSTSGGASVPRIHRPESGEAVGKYIVKGMAKQCADRGVAAKCNMDANEIIMEDGHVAGIKATNAAGRTVVYHSKAVIMTTGGFGANHKMLAQYRPELLDAVTTNQPGAQGDGIVMGTEAGADLVDIGQIQVHPTVEQTTATLLSEGIRGDGAILVNTDGNRFINELLTRDVVSAAEWQQPGKGAWAVFDKKVYDENTSIKEKFIARNIITVADTLESLADKMGVPQEAFMATLDSYNQNIADGTDDPLGRWKSLYPIDEAPFYAVAVAPGIHHCMGGLRIDDKAQVLDADGNPIPGFFAAGEVTGGIHGGNRLGGNAVCDINVFGRRSQQTAVEYVQQS